MLVPQNEPERMEKRFGGHGHIFMQKLLAKEQLKDSAELCGIATLEKGCSIGLHRHIGNNETYHILKGKALYTDDEKQYEIQAGDTVFCAEGHEHAIANAGETDLVFFALVLCDKK